MLPLKSTLHLAHNTHFERLHSFHKPTHAKPSKSSIEVLQKKESATRQSQVSTGKMHESQLRKKGTYFSSCSLFQAKRVKTRQFYERNHSSGWLDKILTKKAYNDKQQYLMIQSQEKISKLLCKEDSSNKKIRKDLDKEILQIRVGCRGIRVGYETGEYIRSLKRLNNKRRNLNLRLTQPSESDRKKKKQIILKAFNEIDINLSPWIHQYCQ